MRLVNRVLIMTALVAVPAVGSAQGAMVDVMTPLAGRVPITIDGQIVRAVGISGAASAQQDEELAKVAAAAVK
jgi:uncharacterized protein GlcG (DUF336 family)